MGIAASRNVGGWIVFVTTTATCGVHALVVAPGRGSSHGLRTTSGRHTAAADSSSSSRRLVTRELRADDDSDAPHWQSQGGEIFKVAFQGEHGAYSEEAAYQHFGSRIETVPLSSFEAVFSAVESGEAQYGMLPMENSQAGSINKSYDLLLEYDLRVHGETTLRVRHALMALPQEEEGETVVPLTTVRSHPQALAQCERYITANALKIEAGADTAGSAREIAEGKISGVGAICSRLAASRYGLEIVAYGIEDYEYNFTRFFVLGKGDARKPKLQPKTSLAFAVSDKPGALCTALNEFGKANVNLIKLESRPRRRTVAPGFNYVFFVDFEGGNPPNNDDGKDDDNNTGAALLGLLNNCAFVKLLGSYEAAPPIEYNKDDAAALDQSLMQI